MVTLVYDGEAEQSYLMLLDATTFLPVAQADLPYPVPWSAHGNFFMENEIKRS